MSGTSDTLPATRMERFNCAAQHSPGFNYEDSPRDMGGSTLAPMAPTSLTGARMLKNTIKDTKVLR